MLPPTSERLLAPDCVPYFLWDLKLTVAEVRRVLSSDEREARDEVIGRILREANTRDVWLFLDWAAIDEAWDRVAHRLGRSRRVWEMMREFRRRHAHAAR